MSVTAPPPTPPTPTPPTEECPLCGAPLGAEQEWCLRCGGAARTRLAAIPNWRTPIVALSVVVVLSLGALSAALVSLAGELDGERGGRLRDVDRHGSRGGGSDERGDKLHGGRARGDGTHDDGRSGDHTGSDHAWDCEKHAGNDHTRSCRGNQHTGDDGPRGKHHPHDTRGGGHPDDEHPGRETAGDGRHDDRHNGNGMGQGRAPGGGQARRKKALQRCGKCSRKPPAAAARPRARRRGKGLSLLARTPGYGRWPS